MEAPWHGEPVSRVIRVLAWVLLFYFLIAAVAVGFETAQQGVRFLLGSDWNDYRELSVSCCLGAYFVALVVKVAFTGHAPKTWLPWR
ncbi:hypothetical protein [Shewanella sp.]|uniref:hypothetical protein n=1 Tax=Shewanella sp. TaxID=50422 RepID=UPI003A97F054